MIRKFGYRCVGCGGLNFAYITGTLSKVKSFICKGCGTRVTVPSKLAEDLADRYETEQARHFAGLDDEDGKKSSVIKRTKDGED